MRSLLVAGSVAAGVGALFVAASCVTKETGPSYPAGARAVPASFPTLSVHGLPSACTGKVYYTASTSLCSAGLTYFLCDGSSYTEYDCSDPGAGWTRETLSQYDRTATGPSCGSVGGTVYIEANAAAPGANSLLAFRYCDAGMPALPEQRYLTGGTGGADLNDNGFLDADQQVVVNDDQSLLFAVNQGSDTVAAFHIGSGVITPVKGSPFPSGGLAPTSLGISGNILIVANKASDGVRDLSTAIPSYTTFAIGTDGALSPTGTNFKLPALSSPTQAYVAPGGTLMFGTEESGNLRALQIGADGSLTNAPGSPLRLPDSLFVNADGGRPRVVWPAGLSAWNGMLYTGIPNSDTIAALSFTSDGALSFVDGEVDGNAYLPCWSIVNAAGTRLYVANAGSGNIGVWDIATDPKHPARVQTWTVQGGGNPWGLRFDPGNTILFAITPRQVHQVPIGQGQYLHGLKVDADGMIVDELPGSPVTLPVAPLTNPLGIVAVTK